MNENEIKKLVEKCIKCGLCKEICPVFRILLIESYSPRGKILTIKEKDEKMISFYCTTCNGCKLKCPLNIDISKVMIYFRKFENEQGREKDPNKRMIENIRKYGNPFGKIEKGKTPKELYCC